jgi:uncharacterized RDD family membrane protein YckC
MEGIVETTANSGTPVVCSECGRRFPADEVIRHGNSYICAQCKPLFMQKLAEGASIRKGMHYVGFWWRFAAYMIDGVILFAVNFVISLGLGLSTLQFVGLDRGSAGLLTLALSSFISLAIQLAYEVYFIGAYGATPGKRACKIKVVRADGSPVGYALALGRFFAKILSSITLLIGYIMAAFDSEKRALHDRICDTRVIDSFQFKSVGILS